MRHLIKLGAICAGATAGAAIGVLLAPEKGTKLRGKIKNQLKSSGETFKHSKDTLKDIVSAFIPLDKANFETKLTSVIDKAGNTAEEVITILEHKLSELKADASDKDHNKSSESKEDVVLKAAYETKVNL